jgi:hypothetical protein
MYPRQEERLRGLITSLPLCFTCHDYMTVWGKVSYLLSVHLMIYLEGEYWSENPINILSYILPASVLTWLFQDLTITMTRDVNTVTLFPKIMMSRDLLYTCQLFQWRKKSLRHWYSNDYVTHPEVCMIVYGLDFHSNTSKQHDKRYTKNAPPTIAAVTDFHKLPPLICAR